jgi:predicted N-acyltransferase
VGAELGWIPQHLAVYDCEQRLLGAVPMYTKLNSYGELVFDWAWASAHQRLGMPYYPKLVVAVPYTPVSGPRLLVARGLDEKRRRQVIAALIEGALSHARDSGSSSLHWLFAPETDIGELEQHGLLRRTGCQFHWHNRGYRDFEDFLDHFNSSKRKKARRERRRVQEAGVTVDILRGDEAAEEDWATFHRFYRSTFDRLGGIATLSLPFFHEIAQTMGRQLVLARALWQGRTVAAALCVRGTDVLYGRHWGCETQFHSLHFETCYYRMIEYCIAEGLKRFEPGAQGEHKISRGFLPTRTTSAHWVAHPRLRHAIEVFLAHERAALEAYIEELDPHSPFKQATDAST